MKFLGKAKVCELGFQNPNQDKPSKKSSVQYEGCCNGKTLIKKGNDNLKKGTVEFETETYVFQNRFFNSNTNLFEGLQESVVPFLDYTPPLIFEDMQLLHQVFLI